MKLLIEVDKQAKKFNRKINCLIQVHVADEETKFGISINEIDKVVAEICQHNFKFACITGIMGMATNTDDTQKITGEFELIKKCFKHLKEKFFQENRSFRQISMGMSSDYKLAIKNGSTMVRIGSLIFGER